MKYTYRITTGDDGITAICNEMSVSATGGTPAEALRALRDAICERLMHVEAVAPPDTVPVPSFELLPAAENAPDPQGPGDSPAADRSRFD